MNESNVTSFDATPNAGLALSLGKTNVVSCDQADDTHTPRDLIFEAAS